MIFKQPLGSRDVVRFSNPGGGDLVFTALGGILICNTLYRPKHQIVNEKLMFDLVKLGKFVHRKLFLQK